MTEQNRSILFKLKPALQGDQVADAIDIETIADETQSHGDVQSALTNYGDLIQTLINASTVTGRGFQRRNDNTLVINNLNLADFVDVNTIYAAGIDKIVNWTLPTDADIASTAGVTYPVVMEFTHIGGTARIPAPPNQNSNRVNLDIAGGDTARIRTSTGLQNLMGIDLLQGDVVVITKEAAGQDWFAARSLHDPSTRILPSGTWEFHGEQQTVNNIVNIATELNGIVINSGDVFQVETGGTYWNRDIGNNALIVALVDSPDLTTNGGEDWFVIEDGSGTLTNDQISFFNNVVRTGSRFDFSRNVFVNESNVIAFSSIASGTPTNFVYFDTNGDGTARQRTFANQPIQFTDLQGGTLTLSLSLQLARVSGFAPELTSLVFDYSGATFTFPIDSVNVDGGSMSVNIQIPNADYSSILNTNCDITLNYIYRGVSFVGNINIVGLVNTLDGTLRQSVTDIANTAAMEAEQRLQSQIDQVQSGVSEEDANFAAIQDRISPYRQDAITTPEQGALFNESTGVDPFPTDLSSFTTVNPDNPRFTSGQTALFVAVPVNNSRDFVLQNITQDTITPLVDGGTVSLGESLLYQGQTYFVYRVTGLTVNDVVEVVTVSSVQNVAWQEDIDTLKGEVSALQNEAIDLPDEVRNVLENETSVTEQTTPTVTSSSFNNSLGSGGTQKIFAESSPNTPSGGSLTSNAFSVTNGTARENQKLVYIGTDHVYGNSTLLHAFDGASTTTDLARYINGNIEAIVFVPAQPAGSTTTTIYPSPSNAVSGAGIWQTIETLTFQNGIPVTEADELFFTRNVPSQATTLNIQYRGHANGNLFGAGSTTLANAGGSSEVATTFTVSDGSETATIEVRYYPNFQNGGRAIRVSVTERVNTGLPTINDIQVILSYDETRIIPATPATTRNVVIEQQATTGHSNVIAVKESGIGTLILVGSDAEVDTGYSYTLLFGAGGAGHLTVFSDDAVFYDYENLSIINTTVNLLESHSNQPNFGLFDTTYNHESKLVLDVALQVENSQGDAVNVGEELILVAPNNTRWRLSVDNAGALSTTQVT